MRFKVNARFVLFLLPVFMVVGCGSGGGGGVDNQTNQNGGGSDGGDDTPDVNLFYSDIRDATVSACKSGQAFAFETCWDKVQISDIGTITVESGLQVRTIADSDFLTNELSDAYELYSTCQSGSFGSTDMTLSVKALSKRHEAASYWFLPGKFSIFNTNNDCLQANQKIEEFQVNLLSYVNDNKYWYVNGKINICGSSFDLPIKQSQIESACNVSHGKDLIGIIRLPQFNIRVTYNTHGLNPGETVTDRYVSQIMFTHNP